MAIIDGSWPVRDGGRPVGGTGLGTHQRSLSAMVSLETVARTSCTNLQMQLMEYSSGVEGHQTASEVLDHLSTITASGMQLCVLGAVRLPLKSGDWEAIQLGKSAFLHKDVPKGWWEEYNALARGKFRPMLYLAQSSLASHTWTEIRRMLQPIGIDRWADELALKYGMRDGLTCPVGGRWVVAFWSRRDVSKALTPHMRIMIVAAASFAALRLEQLVSLDARRIGDRVHLTARETAALRLVSTGSRCHEAAQALGLGDETIRSHLKNAQAKLGARNRTHAVAEALRQSLIP